MANGNGAEPRTISLHTSLQLGVLVLVLTATAGLYALLEGKQAALRADLTALIKEERSTDQVEQGRLANELLSARTKHDADSERLAQMLIAHEKQPTHAGTAEKLATIEPLLRDLKNQLDAAGHENDTVHAQVRRELGELRAGDAAVVERQSALREALAEARAQLAALHFQLATIQSTLPLCCQSGKHVLPTNRSNEGEVQ